MVGHAFPVFDQPVRPVRALLSVSDKTGIVDFARTLQGYGIALVSTGGTFATLQNAGLDVVDAASLTQYPEMMDGRVKTLHPAIHGGILARRDQTAHTDAMTAHHILPIDIVVLSLYPFSSTVASGADWPLCIENIDIGGPAMIRAAAKNHDFVSVLTDPTDYAGFLATLSAHGGTVPYATRRALAAQAFARTAAYDAAIAQYMAAQIGTDWPAPLTMTGHKPQVLRYGENPHQSAAFYHDGTGRAGVATARQLQGKELSYNNINDTDAAFELVSEFTDPTVAIIKHANPCGVATADTLAHAYTRALACDPVSAFGGIIALNRPLDGATAALITGIFTEVIIAPSATDEAVAIVAAKKNLRLLVTGGMPNVFDNRRTIRTVSGGFLVQQADCGHVTRADLKVVTARAPTDAEYDDLLFAFRVAKHVKSNAIIYARELATVGIGAGQMSRIDSSRIAAWKAAEAARLEGLQHPLTQGSVVASDAFFPFADGLIAAADSGVTAVIQPGGSVRDDEVIAAANARGLAMVFTGMRHFRH